MLGILKSTKKIGDAAEKAAERFLNQQGMQTIEKQFSCSGGEIDLIMKHNDYIVFTEVRYRKQITHGSGSETIDKRKQKKIIFAAQTYLQKHNKTNTQACRFDVISMSGSLRNPEINWLRDAFGVC